MKTVHAVITGRVQGVFYRAWTEEQAQALGLSGWVRNRQDGSVEAVFHGPEEAVDDMLRRCHDGPAAARVEQVAAEPYDGDPGQGFRKTG
ncbi:acylphosphatase [Caenispirillum salinarum]|uniref:acylphosphatase n=1 Tax=Caenispirillum salinarum TaxID=859058 RepID=UPI003850A15A